MSLNKAYIALGTNVGNWKNNFNQSFKFLNELGYINKYSSFYLSRPYGYKNQNFFYNTAIEFQTSLALYKLFFEIQLIEKKIHKKKPFINGPRKIDLDIIFFNNISLSSDILTVPHSKAHLRDFVIYPLAELNPFYTHPIIKKTLIELKKNIKTDYVYKIIRRQRGSLKIY